MCSLIIYVLQNSIFQILSVKKFLVKGAGNFLDGIDVGIMFSMGSKTKANFSFKLHDYYDVVEVFVDLVLFGFYVEFQVNISLIAPDWRTFF